VPPIVGASQGALFLAAFEAKNYLNPKPHTLLIYLQELSCFQDQACNYLMADFPSFIVKLLG